MIGVFAMSETILYHGSPVVVERPLLEAGKPHNDYGRGFYCTRSWDMAGEWACKGGSDGFVNAYSLDLGSLRVLDLLDGSYTVLNWMALLLANRVFSLRSALASDAREYLLARFLPDTSQYDVVLGYRADDSYFSYAEQFVENGLPVRKLGEALRLGELGEQTALVSQRAFDALRFADASVAEASVYYPRFSQRDNAAREKFRSELRSARNYKDDVFVLDLMRGEVRNDDARIPRMLR